MCALVVELYAVVYICILHKYRKALLFVENLMLIYALFVSVIYPFCIQYPLVHIQGEESASFTNGLGETADLQITDDEANTVERLTKILDGDDTAAELLATEVHRSVIYEHGDIEAVPDLVIL